MDTSMKDGRLMEVDNIDDEIYYREILGCTTVKEGSGGCATLDCLDGTLHVCRKPGPRGSSDQATPDGFSLGEVPC